MPFSPDITRIMSNTYRLAGTGTFFQTLLRGLFVTAAVVGSFFLLAFSAAFIVFILVGLFLFGMIVFVWFWVRAKFFGKSLAAQMAFETKNSGNTAPDTASDTTSGTNRKRSQNAAVDGSVSFDGSNSGPVIDAHKTPEGWSVDT